VIWLWSALAAVLIAGGVVLLLSPGLEGGPGYGIWALSLAVLPIVMIGFGLRRRLK
jgi:hypothetical protein